MKAISIQKRKFEYQVVFGYYFREKGLMPTVQGDCVFKHVDNSETLSTEHLRKLVIANLHSDNLITCHNDYDNGTIDFRYFDITFGPISYSPTEVDEAPNKINTHRR